MAVDGVDGLLEVSDSLWELEKIPVVVTTQLDGTARERHEYRTTLCTPAELPDYRTVCLLGRDKWNPLSCPDNAPRVGRRVLKWSNGPRSTWPLPVSVTPRVQSCLSSLTLAHKILGLCLPRYVRRRFLSIPSPMEQSQQQQQRSVLVTGGAGFIGTHTVLQLLKEGFLVTIIDNLDNSVPEAVDRVRLLAGPKLSLNLRFFIVIYLFFVFYSPVLSICRSCSNFGLHPGFANREI
ncbi:hypothetical protein BHE74_00053254 [Ensete ventricosum]|nr:hypothetical protein BHE74_00053254 [Ensete ventricosum]